MILLPRCIRLEAARHLLSFQDKLYKLYWQYHQSVSGVWLQLHTLYHTLTSVLDDNIFNFCWWILTQNVDFLFSTTSSIIMNYGGIRHSFRSYSSCDTGSQNQICAFIGDYERFKFTILALEVWLVASVVVVSITFHDILFLWTIFL